MIDWGWNLVNDEMMVLRELKLSKVWAGEGDLRFTARVNIPKLRIA